MLINLPSLIHFLLTWFWQTHLKAFYLKAFRRFMMKQTYEREREIERERDTEREREDQAHLEIEFF